MLILSALDEVCSSSSMGIVLYIIKNILTLLQIIAPILLIVSLVIIFVKGTFNPDDKKLMNKIKNACIATALIFFMPLCFNLVMSITDNNLTFAKCYKNVNYAFKDKSATYIELDGKTEDDKKQVLTDKTLYEDGDEEENSMALDGNYTSSSTGVLAAAKAMSDYVKNDTPNSWYYAYSGRKQTFDEAVSSGVKKLTCVVLVDWALKKVGVLKKGQLVYQDSSGNIKYKKGAKESIQQHGFISTFSLPVSFDYVKKNLGLVPGDIIIYSYGHFNIYADSKGNKYKFYASGHDGPGNYKNGKYYFTSFETGYHKKSGSKIVGLIRITK